MAICTRQRFRKTVCPGFAPATTAPIRAPPLQSLVGRLSPILKPIDGAPRFCSLVGHLGTVVHDLKRRIRSRKAKRPQIILKTASEALISSRARPKILLANQVIDTKTGFPSKTLSSGSWSEQALDGDPQPAGPRSAVEPVLRYFPTEE